MRSSKLLSLALVALVWACGGAQQLIQQGNKLLAEGKHDQAVEKYQEALKIEPDNAQAKERIKEARREAVRAQLDLAEQSLSASQFASALKDALKARRMPLDLEDVQLVRRIDETIAKSAKLAEERVESFVEQGHFVPAVELSAQVRDASPGMSAREKWAREVQSRAAEHYQRLASESEAALPGSAAIQLAMAKKAGANVDAAKVADLWNRFAVPTCFGEPQVSVGDKTGKAGPLTSSLEIAARTALNELRTRCGHGTQQLGVTITIAKLDVVDKTAKEKAVRPLPGVRIQTEEVYYEEEPYAVMEEVTEYEVRKEVQEKRDCAPRPGKERGCRTWTEEVDVQVPVKRVKEVQKIRRIEKRRPIVDDLPADKVVSFEVTRVTRRVSVSGTIAVLGAVGAPRAFALVEESVDDGWAELVHPKMTVAADPLEAKAMDAVVAGASAAVSREVGAAVGAAVEGWTKRFEEDAAKQVLAGRLLEAEELYLKLLALGVGSKGVSQFFDRRYGRSVDQVMTSLAQALGRTVEAAPSGEAVAKAGATVFPKLAPEGRDAAETPVEAPVQSTVAPTPATPMVPRRAPETKPSISDDELKKLEEESLAETKPPEAAPEAGATPTEGQPPPTPEQKPEGSGSEEPKARGPIKPKT
jgi:tetratricopeptide (TPR) repeat protein